MTRPTISRRSFLQGSAAVIGVTAAGRAPAFAQGTKLHIVRWVDFIPEADVELKRQAPEASKALGAEVTFEFINANDLQPQMIEMLRRRLAAQQITNVTLVQGAIDDPGLPAASVDLELMVDVYHELSRPQPMLQKLRRALKPGGRLVLLEYRKEDPSIPIKFEHKMSVQEAKAEVEAEGFTLSKVDESLPRQHVLIFTVAVH